MRTHDKKHKIDKGEHYPELGNFIKYHIAQKNVKKTDVANALGILPNGMTAYLKRDSLQFAILWKLSLAMKHNFLAQLGEYLPYRFETMRERALLKELAERNELIKKMEIQLAVFREVNKIRSEFKESVLF